MSRMCEIGLILGNNDSDETDGVREMRAERNRSSEWYGTSGPLPQTRRRPTRTEDNGHATAQNR